MLEDLAAMRRDLDAREAAFHVAVAAYERSQQWRDDGFQSPGAALRDRMRLTEAQSFQMLRTADRLERMPRLRGAFLEGDISLRHVHEITRPMKNMARVKAITEIEDTLVELAMAKTTDETRAAVRYLTDAVDHDKGARRDLDVHEERALYVNEVGNAIAINGSGSLEAGEYILSALDAEMERDFQRGDVRSRAQRRFDALESLCRQFLDAGVLESDHRIRPHLSCVLDVQRLGADKHDLLHDVRAEFGHVSYLSQATIDRIACDCSISRVITDGPGQVLDVGRATRTIPTPIWRALVARDGGCRRCRRRPGMCEGHHIIPWENGGPTNLDNLVLLCWSCHRQWHINEVLGRPMEHFLRPVDAPVLARGP
jgi:5-methylcytosine-specific restriction protein A